MSVLNIAGPEYDFGSVVFVVLGECEHRRRGFDDDLEEPLMEVARAKLKKIREAYDEFGGSPAYWAALETEVLQTAMPQYIQSAREMNALERSKFGVWRGGDPVARAVFGLGGLVTGSLTILLPYVRVFEVFFAFGLAAAGVLYPEIKRFTHERRHFRTLNRLISEAAAYQRNAQLHYMTTRDIRESFRTAAGGESPSTSAEREVAD